MANYVEIYYVEEVLWKEKNSSTKQQHKASRTPYGIFELCSLEEKIKKPDLGIEPGTNIIRGGRYAIQANQEASRLQGNVKLTTQCQALNMENQFWESHTAE